MGFWAGRISRRRNLGLREKEKDPREMPGPSQPDMEAGKLDIQNERKVKGPKAKGR